MKHEKVTYEISFSSQGALLEQMGFPKKSKMECIVKPVDGYKERTVPADDIILTVIWSEEVHGAKK